MEQEKKLGGMTRGVRVKLKLMIMMDLSVNVQ